MIDTATNNDEKRRQLTVMKKGDKQATIDDGE